MKNFKEKYKNNKRVMIFTILSIVLFVVLIVGATYAYFGTDQINSSSISNVSASTESVGSVTLVDGNNVSLKITANHMKIPTSDVTYWATTDGTPSTTRQNIPIATANVVGNGIMYCDYKMTVQKNATSTANDLFLTYRNWSSTDKTNGQIVLEINNGDTTNNIQTYDFNNTSLNFPITYNGRISGLQDGTPRNINASFKLVNLKNVDQTVLAGKNVSFKFTFTDFQCEIQGDSAPVLPANTNKYAAGVGKELATYIYDNADSIPSVWRSGLENDGLRFVGSGTATDEKTPNNFVCFGASTAADCTSATGVQRYLYRMIGVFKDEAGNNHAKLIKYQSFPSLVAWHNSSGDVAWDTAYMNVSYLNGSSFLNSSTYMPNETWKNKITNWRWTAANGTATSTTSYQSVLSPTNAYLHEMNRSTKTVANGTWTNPSAKIGLMYASDYALSLGKDAKSMTTSSNANRDKLLTSWMHLKNNSYGYTSSNYTSEWTMARYGYVSSYSRPYLILANGELDVNNQASSSYSFRPVFYLNSDVTLKSGSGTLSDPLLLN